MGPVEAAVRDAPANTRQSCPASHFEVDERYTLKRMVGRGAYGVVASALDRRTGGRVAIKKITQAFANATDARRTLREVKLLRHLRHENVVTLLDVLRPVGGLAAFSEVYLVYELMDTDLHQIIRSGQPLTEEHCAYFMYQILRGLSFIHSAGVLHRDLKPSNLLLNANCDLKICDFGLARTSHRKEEVGILTEYVVTRWYRAPELLLSCDDYDYAVDVWAVGCIFAEMLARKPLFPGKDYLHQLRLILNFLGTPQPEGALAFVSNEKAASWLRALPPRPRVALSAALGGCSKEAADLFDRLLIFNPAGRMGVAEALRHPFLLPLSESSGGSEWEWDGGDGASAEAAGESAASTLPVDVAPPFEHDDRVETGDEATLRMLLFAECGFGEGRQCAPGQAGDTSVAEVGAATEQEAEEAPL